MQGDAGAPVHESEIPVLNKAWRALKDELRPRAREVVEQHGLIAGTGDDLELACTDGAECVFVKYRGDGAAICAIHEAWFQGRISWPKPISCHLYPLRIIEAGGYDYINFEYIPDMCSTACDTAKKTGTYLAEYLKGPLVRKYGSEWYQQFLEECKKIREQTGKI